MDIKLIVAALEEYEKFKGLIPAIKAEYEQILGMISKAKELYQKEKQALDDVISKKVSLSDEISKQKDAFLKEMTEGKLEVLNLRTGADEIMRQANLLKAEVEAHKAELDKAKAEHQSLSDKLKADIAKIKEVIKNIF